ncbi:MAG: terminase small subunit, partial [Nitrosospira sp.]
MPSSLPVPLTESLSAKMRFFVDHYVSQGGRHQGRAAIMAGYSRSAADAVASRLLRRPDVLALLRHIVETRIKADVVTSADTLRIEAKVRGRREM